MSQSILIVTVTQIRYLLNTAYTPKKDIENNTWFVNIHIASFNNPNKEVQIYPFFLDFIPANNGIKPLYFNFLCMFFFFLTFFFLYTWSYIYISRAHYTCLIVLIAAVMMIKNSNENGDNNGINPIIPLRGRLPVT